MRDRTSSGELLNVLFQDDRDPLVSRTVVAERATLNRTGEIYKLQLETGNVQEFDRNRRKVSLVYFDRYVLEVDTGELLGRGEREQGIAERHIGRLLNPPTATHRDRELRNKAMAEGHQRLSSPLLCLSYMAIALAALFVGDFNRRGSTRRMIVAAGIVAAVQALHLLVINAASLNPAMLPAIHLNAIVPGLVAAMLLYRGDRRVRLPGWLNVAARRAATAEPSAR
jgi:lipopolysaccharide export system permease protein